MKKHKLEIGIGLIFAGLLVSFLWTTLAGIWSPLPMVLGGVLAVALVALLIPWQESGTEGADKEKYAPKYFAQAFVSSLVGIAVIIGVAAVLNRERFSKTFDLTERKVNSLSDETEKFLTSLEKEVEIWCVPSMSQQERYCEDSMQLRRLYAEKSKKLAIENLNLTNIQMVQHVKPAGYGRLVLISKDNRSEIVGKVTESKLTNGLINLIKSKKVVYFLTGSGEPAISPEMGGQASYAQLAEVLKARAYEVKEHSITNGDLPEDATMVVAGSAKVPYSGIVENMLRRVLAKGGRVFLTLNPYREPGMNKLFADLGIKLEDTLLVNNRGATPLGAQLAQLDPMRPPLVVGEFSRESPVTSVFSPRDIALADGARPFAFETKEADGMKIKHTKMMSAFHAAPVSVTPQQRNELPLEGPLNVTLPSSFDAKKSYTVGVQIEIESPEKLAEGLPAATVAMGGGTTGLDTASQKAADAKAPASAPADGKNPQTTGDAAKKDEKKTAEVVLLGFDVAGRFEGAAPANAQILPLSIAHLYRDKELISIPTKDFAPKAFNLEKNPGAYVFLFSGLLPIATALTGFYIWMRRRSA